MQPYAAFSGGQLLTILIENLVGKYLGGKMVDAVSAAERKRAEAAARERSERRRRSLLQRAAECSARGCKSARASPGETRHAVASHSWRSACGRRCRGRAGSLAASGRRPVRARLEKPPSKLTLQERPADFTVHIEKRRPMQDIFDVPAWATDPVGWQPPGIGFEFVERFPLHQTRPRRAAARARRSVRPSRRYCNGPAKPRGGEFKSATPDATSRRLERSR